MTGNLGWPTTDFLDPAPSVECYRVVLRYRVPPFRIRQNGFVERDELRKHIADLSQASFEEEEFMTELTYVKHKRVSLKSQPEFNEKWLQDRIADDPTILGLGELSFWTENATRNELADSISC